MKKQQKLLVAACSLLMAALPAAAHHSFAAEYDAKKPITLKGKVTQVEWINPHSWVRIDVTDENGKTVSWQCETAPPNILYRQGWRRSSIKEGDEVVIEGFAAKDASHTMTASSVTTPDGRRLLAGSPTDGAPPAQKSDK